jgi:ADP-ribosylglycohydrolase
MNDRLIDQIRGCIYGHAIGDALGVGAENLSKRQVSKYYPGGLRDYSQFIKRVTRGWSPGEWTDDTEQMLCILESIIEKKDVDILDIAKRFLQWKEDDGRGIGSTVGAVLSSPDFLRDPHSRSKYVWELSQKRSAANGAIMRTSVLGIWDFREPKRVKENAEMVCKMTHCDPRCVGSCVLISLVISSLLWGETDIRTAVDDAASVAAVYDPGIQKYVNISKSRSPDDLKLDEGLEPGGQPAIGYTLKAMGAGLWAVLNSEYFEKGLVEIINEGGDADSNAVVAGALLGARFGYSRIPERWKEGLIKKDRLDNDINRFISLLKG